MPIIPQFKIAKRGENGNYFRPFYEHKGNTRGGFSCVVIETFKILQKHLIRQKDREFNTLRLFHVNYKMTTTIHFPEYSFPIQLLSLRILLYHHLNNPARLYQLKIHS